MRLRLPFYFALSSSVSVALLGVFAACTRPEPNLDKDFELQDASVRNRDTGGPEEEVLPEEDPVGPDGAKPPGIVYAHTAKSLYLFDPLAKTLTKRGDFTCIGSSSMIDIAVNAEGEVYGTTFTSFVKINPEDATCTIIRDELSFPNSLGFVPKGTIDDNVEALVGYMPGEFSGSTDYVRVDLTTGITSKIGSLNRPGAPVMFKSSGDIIAMSRNGNRAFLTITRLFAPETGTNNDFLAEINPKTGEIEATFGEMAFNRLYGFGQWAGTGWAFSETGDIIQINLDNGEASLFQNAKDEDGGVLQWFGAGVTTASPTKP